MHFLIDETLRRGWPAIRRPRCIDIDFDGWASKDEIVDFAGYPSFTLGPAAGAIRIPLR
jgi:hypothetical protein